MFISNMQNDAMLTLAHQYIFPYRDASVGRCADMHHLQVYTRHEPPGCASEMLPRAAAEARRRHMPIPDVVLCSCNGSVARFDFGITLF
jgi:hypothetical protein